MDYVSFISTLVLVVISLISFIYVSDRRKADKEREEILKRVDSVEGKVTQCDEKVDGVIVNYLDRFKSLTEHVTKKIEPLQTNIATLIERTKNLK